MVNILVVTHEINKNNFLVRKRIVNTNRSLINFMGTS